MDHRRHGVPRTLRSLSQTLMHAVAVVLNFSITALVPDVPRRSRFWLLPSAWISFLESSLCPSTAPLYMVGNLWVSHTIA